jgi:multicomponent K+:H+ antiporter subunit E
MLTRLVPHPLLSLTLSSSGWAGEQVHAGQPDPRNGFGLVIPMLTAPTGPTGPPSAALKIIEYFLVVLWDIVVANVQVALIILFKREPNIRSHWIPVPLELTSAEAITVLAGTITMTPGTVSATLSADGRAILVHCLHTDDPDSVRDEIKTRYERRLLEISE